MNFGIIILNYLAYNVTIDCVKSFLKQDYKENDYHIVIVDNGSPNDSYKKLKESFKENEKISIVQSIHNIGFAGGNNLGYEKLKGIFIPDFVIVSNDDIILQEPGIIDWIQDSYDNYRFAILGPSVFSVNNGIYQSPMKRRGYDAKSCRKRIISSMFSLVIMIIKKMFHSPIEKQEIQGVAMEDIIQTTCDKTIHGSFQIFSKEYFSHYTEPYDPNTFLYLEEDILRYRCDKKGLIMLYSPQYTVNHLQAVSTSMVTQNEYDRIINRQRNMIKSLKYYYKLICQKNVGPYLKTLSK